MSHCAGTDVLAPQKMSDRVDHRIPKPSVLLLIPNNSASVFDAPPSALGVSEDVQIDSVAVADRPGAAIAHCAPLRT